MSSQAPPKAVPARLEAYLDAAAFWLLVATVALAPLPLGSNRPMPSAILTLASGLCLALACGAMLLRREATALPVPASLKVAIACFLLVGLWVLIQLATFLPEPLAHPLWREAAHILGRPDIEGRITLDAQSTWTTLSATAGYFAIAMSAVLTVRDARRARQAALALCISGGAYALYGLIMWSSGLEMVLWYPKIDYFGVVTSTFINRNSFATYAGLVSLVGFGLVFAELYELRHIAGGSRFQRVARIGEMLIRRQWLVLLSLMLLMPALLFTLSRGGMAAFLVGASVLLLLLTQASLLPRVWRWRSLAIFLVSAVCAVFLFGQTFVERLSNEGVTDAYRKEAWSITLDGIKTSPLLGHGFGAFPEGFALYRDDRLPSRRFWDKAHDTYLELAFDLGLPATVVLLAGFAALVTQMWKGLNRRRRERRVLPAVGLAALALGATHSLVDFSLQIPADAALFACLLGLAVAESGLWSRGRREQDA